MDRRRSWSMYSPHFKRPGPGEDEGWRTTFQLLFVIMVLLGAGSVLMVAQTVGAFERRDAAAASQDPGASAARRLAGPASPTP